MIILTKCFQIYNIQSILVNTSNNNASGTSTNIDNKLIFGNASLG